MGRHKIQFTATQIEEIERMAGIGLSEKQIAAVLGVSYKTLWRRKNGDGQVLRTEIKEALERGKATAERRVGDALIQRAEKGDVQAIRWYEMTRAGRTEQKRLEISEMPSIAVHIEYDDGDTTDQTPET